MMAPPSAPIEGAARQADFRSLSPVLVPMQTTSSSTPQTGLGILMNNKSAPPQAGGAAPGYALASMTAEQRQMVQDDLADRERQASSLAAAGMVAETVHPPQGVGLMAPPMLAPPMMAPPLPAGTTTPPTTMDGFNWSLQDELGGGGGTMDDIEMDFAKLFDPAHEEANMQTGEGNGWPAATASEQQQGTTTNATNIL